VYIYKTVVAVKEYIGTAAFVKEEEKSVSKKKARVESRVQVG